MYKRKCSLGASKGLSKAQGAKGSWQAWRMKSWSQTWICCLENEELNFVLQRV